MTFVSVYDIDCVLLVLILSHGRPKTICIMKNISYESHVTCGLMKLNLKFFYLESIVTLYVHVDNYNVYPTKMCMCTCARGIA